MTFQCNGYVPLPPLGERRHCKTALAEEMTDAQAEHLHDLLMLTTVDGEHHRIACNKSRPEGSPWSEMWNCLVPTDSVGMMGMTFHVGCKQARLNRLATRIIHTPRQRWIESSQATMVFGFFIALNIILVGVQADLPIPEVDFQDGYYLSWFVIESSFIVVFSLEVVLWFRALGSSFFYDPAHLFDVILVFLSIIDTWVFLILVSIPSESLRFTSVFRTLRLLRVLRVLRLFRFCKTLWVVINTMVKALSALSWIILLMVLFCYMVAVTIRLTLGVTMYEKLEGAALETSKLRWGTVWQSMFTLFVCMTGEAWYDIAMDAVAVEGWMYLIFVPFMCLANFLLVNLFVGIMCEKVSHERRKADHLAEQEADEDMVAALAQIFVVIDKDGSDEISVKELSEAIRCDKIKQQFDALDISVSGTSTALMRFFDDGPGGDGVIGFEEFVNGCMLLRNSGLEVKIWFLQDEVRQLTDRLLGVLDVHGLNFAAGEYEHRQASKICNGGSDHSCRANEDPDGSKFATGESEQPQALKKDIGGRDHACPEKEDRLKKSSTADFAEAFAWKVDTALRQVRRGLTEEFTSTLADAIAQAEKAVLEEQTVELQRRAEHVAQLEIDLAAARAAATAGSAYELHESEALAACPAVAEAHSVVFGEAETFECTGEIVLGKESSIAEISVPGKAGKLRRKVKKNKAVILSKANGADDALRRTESITRTTSTRTVEDAAQNESAPRVTHVGVAEDAARRESAPRFTSMDTAEIAARRESAGTDTVEVTAEFESTARGSAVNAAAPVLQGLETVAEAAKDLPRPHHSTVQQDIGSEHTAVLAEESTQKVPPDRPTEDYDPANEEQSRQVSGGGQCLTGDIGAGEAGPLDFEFELSERPPPEPETAAVGGLPD